MNSRELRPDHVRMTDAEFRIARHGLGVNQDWLGRRLNVSERTVRNWEDGKHQIPPGVADEINAMVAELQQAAQAMTAQIDHIDLPVIYTYRDDRDYYDANPGGPHCAGWHRAMAGLVATGNSQAVVAYYSRPPQLDAEYAEQLADVMNGVFIDAAARSAPKPFLIGEIEECRDDATGKTAYPELLAAAREWTETEAAGMLNSFADAR